MFNVITEQMQAAGYELERRIKEYARLMEETEDVYRCIKNMTGMSEVSGRLRLRLREMEEERAAMERFCREMDHVREAYQWAERCASDYCEGKRRVFRIQRAAELYRDGIQTGGGSIKEYIR